MFSVPDAAFVRVLEPARDPDTVKELLFVVVPLMVRYGIARLPLMFCAVPLNVCTPVALAL